jgi:hypothetical protein
MDPDTKSQLIASGNFSVVHHLLDSDSAENRIQSALELDKKCVANGFDFASSMAGKMRT